MLSFPLLAQLAWTGFSTSMSYCLFAVAFALVLKINQVWNFAQAAMMVVAYYGLYVAFRLWGLPLLPGLAISVVTTIAAACLLEWYGFRVLRRRRSANLSFFIFTIITAQLFVYLAELIFGTEPQTLLPTLMSPVTLVGPVAVSRWDLVAIAAAATLLTALWGFLSWTRAGRRMIAVADNPGLAELFGISVARNYLGAMVIASVLVVAGMYLVGTKSPMVPSSPLNQFLIFAIIATLLAGIGSVFAAGLAAVALGLIQAFSILVISSRWQIMIIYGLIIVSIMLFPKGVRLPSRRPAATPAAPPAVAPNAAG